MGRVLSIGLCFVCATSFAADISWSGRYRFEGVFLRNTGLNATNSGTEDSYFIHHLILKPKIIASDGLDIHSRFDIFNNGLSNNQAGQVFGSYSGASSTGSQANPPAVLTKNQQDETIAVTELYLQWVNEFGGPIVGRVPFHFGLGMVFNEGDGFFDHALSTKDIVGYKLALGNFMIMPAYGKVRESLLTAEDDINDYIILVNYDSPDKGLMMGFLFDNRVAPVDASSPSRGNDMPASFFNTNKFTNAQVYDGYNAYNMNFFVKKKMDNFSVAGELGFVNGYTGVKVFNTATSNLERVEISAFGIATDVDYKTGSLELDLRMGMASGDDPDTARFEGYYFSPNYDVAMMMFNYPMGQYDLFKTSLVGSRVASGASSTNAANLVGLDTETISNAIYFSPKITYEVGDKYDLFGILTYGLLHKSPFPTDVATSQGGQPSMSLGFETDLGLNYHPTDRFSWRTEIGLFFPGGAWAGTPALSYKTDFAYGATTKAAINF